MSYIGRFAPSPTGHLHFGSLVAAVASFLDAKANQGLWLMRIEDLDPPRAMAGATDSILRTLDFYQLHWDQDVLYQSNRLDAYEDALNQLRAKGAIYTCDCTRQQIKNHGGIYAGTCRNKTEPATAPVAQRIKVADTCIRFQDQIMGQLEQALSTEVGDFILKRKDGLFAYQLAVVVDDAYQNITHIVRGYDIIDSTARQIYLQQQLGVTTPFYAHIPTINNNTQQKLSKQNLSPEIRIEDAPQNLCRSFSALGMHPPTELSLESLENILNWGIKNWDIKRVCSEPSILESSLPHF